MRNFEFSDSRSLDLPWCWSSLPQPWRCTRSAWNWALIAKDCKGGVPGGVRWSGGRHFQHTCRHGHHEPFLSRLHSQQSRILGVCKLLEHGFQLFNERCAVFVIVFALKVSELIQTPCFVQETCTDCTSVSLPTNIARIYNRLWGRDYWLKSICDSFGTSTFVEFWELWIDPQAAQTSM